MLKLALITAFLVVTVALPFLLFGDQIDAFFAENGLVEWMRGYGAFAWLAAAVLLVADLAIPVPTTAVMAALGMIYGPVLGGAIAAGASILAGSVGYGLCRSLGRPFALWILGPDGLGEGERLFGRMGGWLVALSRWLPVASEVVACMAGLSRMPARVFFAALVCGSVPLGFVFAGIGYLGESESLLTLVLSALLPFLFWLLARPFIVRQS